VRIEVVEDPTCVKLMEDFIAAHPDLWYEDIGE
jgi:cytosine deaminase